MEGDLRDIFPCRGTAMIAVQADRPLRVMVESPSALAICQAGADPGAPKNAELLK